VEGWAEIELEIGDVAEVAERLQELAERFPLRERLALLRMSAPARCGRTGEALGVYAELRKSLAGELGMEPLARRSGSGVRLRRLVDGLRPPVLDRLGLVAALRATAEAFTGSASTSCRDGAGGLSICVGADADVEPLPAAVEVAAYRLTQEALTNVVRHARATRCDVRRERLRHRRTRGGDRRAGPAPGPGRRGDRSARRPGPGRRRAGSGPRQR
jgi:hypothetical protein